MHKIIPITEPEIEAFIASIDRFIVAGGPVDEIRALLSLRDSLRSRAAASDSAMKFADAQAARDIDTATAEGKEHPEWYGDFARDRVMGQVVMGWLTGPGMFDHFEVDGTLTTGW